MLKTFAFWGSGARCMLYECMIVWCWVYYTVGPTLFDCMYVENKAAVCRMLEDCRIVSSNGTLLKIYSCRDLVSRKNVVRGEVFPNVGGWGVWFSNKVQTHQPPQNHPKNRLFGPGFHLLFSQIPQKPLGGWVAVFIQLGKLLIEFRLIQKCNLVMLMLENEMKCEHRDLARVK